MDHTAALGGREDDVCAICLLSLYSPIGDNQNLEENDDAWMLMRTALDGCGHSFHFGCIRPWSRVSSTCPTDRRAFEKLLVYDSNGNLQREVTIDSSITSIWDEIQPGTWTCEVCRRSDRESIIMLCYRCNIGYHADCINLANIPTADWFCSSCNAAMAIAEYEPETIPFATRLQFNISNQRAAVEYFSEQSRRTVRELARARNIGTEDTDLDTLRREVPQDMRQRIERLRRQREVIDNQDELTYRLERLRADMSETVPVANILSSNPRNEEIER
ncbi:hypothetical protein BJ742DRAFT_528880 [Cladochytrium replicatum]|nr:hypothetical protein BJ742DRAFT_528880 [Cladochytrium replicatum]